MRIGQREGGELLVSQKSNVELPAQERRHVIGFACGLNRAYSIWAVDASKLDQLVIDQCLKRHEEECSAPIESTSDSG